MKNTTWRSQALAKLESIRPSLYRLARATAPFSDAANPFEVDGVIMVGIMLYGDTFNSKMPVAFGLIEDGIRRGKIKSSTTVICASSGNTGLCVALLCKMLGLKCRIIMSSDVPDSKVALISALGSPIEVVLHTSKDETTVERARREGKKRGFYDTDQYARDANPAAQCKYLGPQIWKEPQGQRRRIDILVVPGGTLGTAEGLRRYAAENGISTEIILALCAQKQEVPGARTVESIARDVRTASLDDFRHKLVATRYDSFLASYAILSEFPWTPGGPTSGLSYLAALRFVAQLKDQGTLDRYRGTDGKIRIFFLCPDDYRLYASLYKAELKEAADFSSPSIAVSRLLQKAA